MRQLPPAGAALDPPLWTVVPNRARARALSLSLSQPPSSSFDDASTSSTWKKQKYVTVTLENKFPPCLVGGARTQAGHRREREEN